MNKLFLICILFLGISATSSAQTNPTTQTFYGKKVSQSKIDEFTVKIICDNRYNEVCFSIIKPVTEITDKPRINLRTPDGTIDKEGILLDLRKEDDDFLSNHTIIFEREE